MAQLTLRVRAPRGRMRLALAAAYSLAVLRWAGLFPERWVEPASDALARWVGRGVKVWAD